MKYFLHDTNASQDEKILELYDRFGYEGIGLFFTALEKFGYQESPIKTSVLKNHLRVGKRLEKCWEFMEEIGLISTINGESFNEKIMDYSKKYQIQKEKNRERVARHRALHAVNKGFSENVTHYETVTQQGCNASKVNESKSKEYIGASLTPSLFDNDLIGPDDTGSGGKKEISKEQVKKFVEPTVEELTQELIKRNIPNPELNAKKFHASYASKGWIMSNGKKMKSWPHAVINWEASGWFNAVPQMDASGIVKRGKLRF